MDKSIANEKYSHENIFKLISWEFAPNTRAEILESFYKVWPWNKLKGFVFSVIRLEGYMNFFIGMIFESPLSS